MELNTIQSQGTWNEVAGQLNSNFDKIGLGIKSLKDATISNKGYYLNVEALESTHPTATAGSRAYVGSSYPYAIYLWDTETRSWVDSGETGGEEQLELNNIYTKEEVDNKLKLLTPQLLESEDEHQELVESGNIVEGQIYYTVEE